LSKRQHVAPVETAMSGKIDVFDRCICEAQLCCSEPVAQALVGSQRDLPVEHQSEPFVE
jgi:hypothetical protein